VKLSKPLKLLIGVLTVWPCLYLVLFLAVFAFMFLSFGRAGRGPSPAEIQQGFAVLFILHFATMVLVLGLMAFYIVHLFQARSVPQDRKVLWAVILFLGNVFAMPVYWYMHVWRDPQPDLPPVI
jgi:hypothetical protein